MKAVDESARPKIVLTKDMVAQLAGKYLDNVERADVIAAVELDAQAFADELNAFGGKQLIGESNVARAVLVAARRVLGKA